MVARKQNRRTGYDPEVVRLIAQMGNMASHGGTPEQMEEMRLRIRAARLAAEIRWAVAEAPPLPDDVRLELAALLAPAPGQATA